MLAETQRLAIGPYGRFIDVAANIENVPSGYLLHTVCTLSDLALNPPGFSKWQNPAMITMFDSTWAPASRLIHLLILGHEGRLPEMDMSFAGWQRSLLKDFHASLGSGWDQYFPPYDRPPWDEAQALADVIIEKVLQTVEELLWPSAVALYLEDWFQVFAAADRHRSAAAEPLLLGGNSIEELGRLVKLVGAPTVVVPRDGGTEVFSRWCLGLQQAGYARADDRGWNDKVIAGGLGWLMGLRGLLYETRDQLASRLHKPLLGEGGLTLADVLDWYGVRLDDFDG